MITSEFLQAYPRLLTPDQIHHGVEIPEVREAQAYSYNYGLVAQAALRDEREQIEPLMAEIAEFEATHDFHEIEMGLLDHPDGWENRNELNFFGLNDLMGDLWAPLITGSWKGINRQRLLNVAMNSLALDGMSYFAIREQFVRRYGTEALYEPQNEPFLKRFIGAVQEIDTAIVVLDVVKNNPGITVVPAPMQFERSSSGANADLLVIDIDDDRMMGVQVKSTVRDETVAKYDAGRIAIIDGSIDLGNVKVVRTRKGKSTQQVKPWPGIVAASRVHNIQLHGKHQYVPTRYLGHLAGVKMFATQMVGSLGVDHRQLSAAVSERIMSRL
jgi:hypothetical protein